MTMEAETSKDNEESKPGDTENATTENEDLTTLNCDPETIVKHFTWDLGFDKENGSDVSLSGAPEQSRRMLPTVFRWKGEAESIYLSGSYDNWQTKMPLVRSQEDFFTVVEVPEGTHQYKYFVDGEWKCHPNEPKVDNAVGSQNNIFTIKESECDLGDIFSDAGSRIGGEYSQYIPPKETSYCFMRSGPPIIPPHLLETILNREVPAHCEPTFVAEPTHVVLNHLYTLSIKDGVMVMSTTHRFRKKYITTLLYRPIIKK